MNSCAEDIRDMINTHLTDPFEISIGKEPELPIDIISIFETEGYKPQLTFNRAEKYSYPSVQIRVRATSYTKGWGQIRDIFDSLHGRGGETWNGSYYSLIACAHDPFLLDYDKNQYPRFVLNINLQRR